MRWGKGFAPALIAGLALILPAMASAQAVSCRMPGDFAMPRVETARPQDVRRTPITRYQLALSWSPQHCRDRSGYADALQCGGRNGRFGFILHGLWPETTGRDWPQYCHPAPRLPRALIRRHLCMTTSPQLLQHEWARHGVCMTRDPAVYFARAASLHAAIRYPAMTALAARRDLTVGQFARAFAAANPGMRPTMLSVQRNRAGYLDEVRVCLSRSFAWAACPAVSRGAPDAARLRIALRD